jgi:hypothetical protein
VKNGNDHLSDIKKQILSVLKHPEASDGLFFRNFNNLHEEDERPAVAAEDEDLLLALNELVNEGKIRLDEIAGEVVFQLA